MKNIKKILCVLFSALVIISLTNYKIKAIEENSSWNIAWVLLDNISFSDNNITENRSTTNSSLEECKTVAQQFKNFIENSANNSVTINNTFINITERINFKGTLKNSKLQCEVQRLEGDITERYNLETYDTWMVFIPLKVVVVIKTLDIK